MSKRTGRCPDCEQQVQFDVIPSGGATLFRCRNCWHTLDEQAMIGLDKLNAELAKVEAARLAVLKQFGAL